MKGLGRGASRPKARQMKKQHASWKPITQCKPTSEEQDHEADNSGVVTTKNIEEHPDQRHANPDKSSGDRQSRQIRFTFPSGTVCLYAAKLQEAIAGDCGSFLAKGIDVWAVHRDCLLRAMQMQMQRLSQLSDRSAIVLP